MNNEQIKNIEHVEAALTYLKAPALEPVPAFFRSLLSRDWTYTYSDCLNTYRRGAKHLDQLKELYEELKGSMTPEQNELAMRGLIDGVESSQHAEFIDALGNQFHEHKAPNLEAVDFFVMARMVPNEVNQYTEIRDFIGKIRDAVKLPMSYERRLVYSPFMIKSRDLVEYNKRKSIYASDERGYAISSYAEVLIQSLFQHYSAEGILRTALLYDMISDSVFPKIQVSQMTCNLNTHDKITRYGLELGNCWIALSEDTNPIYDKMHKDFHNLRTLFYAQKKGDNKSELIWLYEEFLKRLKYSRAA